MGNVFSGVRTCTCYYYCHLTHSILGLWIGLPNVPYWYVFWKLSSEVSHLHRTPLTSRQSPKIRTTIAWGTCERKSRSSACGRSNIGLPIRLFPSLMQSAVLQIFIKVLNMTYSFQLRCIRCHWWCMLKPNPTTVSVELRFVSFFLSVWGLPTTSICQISCANNQQVKYLKLLVHCSLLGKFPTHQYLGLCCVHCVFSSFQNTNLPMFAMELPFASYCFFRICSLSTASTLPNFVRKQATIWKITNIDTIFTAWKDINPSVPWLIL